LCGDPPPAGIQICIRARRQQNAIHSPNADYVSLRQADRVVSGRNIEALTADCIKTKKPKRLADLTCLVP